MNNGSPFSERIQAAFRPTGRGVVGVVDKLLGVCQEQGLQLDWHANQCQVRSLGPEPHDSTDVPLQKSVFRAILARMAALCNERSPNSVSPYGGEGELSIGADPPTILLVAFTNKPGEQRLEVRRRSDKKVEQVLATLRQWSDKAPSQDEGIRILLAMGEEAVAVIRDPTHWPAFEPLVADHDVACVLLEVCGAPLAQYWWASPRRLLADAGKAWVQSNWRECWDSLDDPIKRGLVEHFAERATVNQ
jgi:hypothetical protein